MDLLLPILGLFGLIFTLAGSRRLRRARARWPWWLAAGVLALCGVAAGYFLGTHPWQLGPDLRIVGLPLPLAASRQEDGHWVDYVHTTTVTIAFLALDILSVMFTLLLPLMLAAYLRHRRPSPALLLARRPQH